MMLSGQALAMTLGQWIVLTGGGPRQPAPVAEATCQEVIVSQVRVHNFSVSLDGFGTGEGQSLDAPFGHAGTRLHEWFFPTRTFRAMQGQPGGGPSTIREFLAAGLIDYAHIVVVPIVLGRGERLWDGLEGLEDRFQIEAVNSPSGVTHVTLSRR